MPDASDAPIGWLLITARVGAEGSLRVRVWRELRRLGAVYLHSGVCLLPTLPAVRDRVAQLRAHVEHGGGSMRVLHIDLLDAADQDWVRSEQRRDRDEEYAEVVERSHEFLAEIDRELSRDRATYAEVEESETDLERYRRWLAKIDARNYCDAPGRAAAVAAVDRCQARLDELLAAALAADDAAPPTPVGRLHVITGEG